MSKENNQYSLPDWLFYFSNKKSGQNSNNGRFDPNFCVEKP
ncbi:MAG: hypothetical protein ACJAW3_000139 [Lentimonas sp.]|jgi:hypothetical protein